jgi:hypothetical protein
MNCLELLVKLCLKHLRWIRNHIVTQIVLQNSVGGRKQNRNTRGLPTHGWRTLKDVLDNNPLASTTPKHPQPRLWANPSHWGTGCCWMHLTRHTATSCENETPRIQYRGCRHCSELRKTCDGRSRQKKNGYSANLKAKGNCSRPCLKITSLLGSHAGRSSMKGMERDPLHTIYPLIHHQSPWTGQQS